MLPTLGLWREIRLEGDRLARLEDVHLRQRHAEGRVTMSVAATVEAWEGASPDLSLRVTDPGGQVQTVDKALTDETQTLSVPISQPQLW